VLVKTLTFDGAASNISMAITSGAKLYLPDMKTFILHPITKKNFFIFLDPCHMLKLAETYLVIGKLYMTKMDKK